jgi:16S rRNA (cytidine1402-2'-O)-methyltransferase
VIATPLGNLSDLSPRADETLRRVTCIACEDTRRTARLLRRHGIETPTLSCHRFNERTRLEPVLERLLSGQDVALVCDGGTPGISDPGSMLVRAALQAGLRVSPLPGPSAVTALLSVSGLPADRYVFEGFLPHRAGERRRRLRELRDETRTVVLFEAPHRIRGSLEDLGQIFGQRPMVLGRELTKRFESIHHGDAAAIAVQLGDEIKGEITIAIAGASPAEKRGALEWEAERIVDAWRDALDKVDGDRRSALRRTARVVGLKRAELYRRLVELGENPDRD